MWSEDITAFIENHSVVFKNEEYYTLPALEDPDQFHVDYINLAGIKYNETSISVNEYDEIYSFLDKYDAEHENRWPTE